MSNRLLLFCLFPFLLSSCVEINKEQGADKKESNVNEKDYVSDGELPFIGKRYYETRKGVSGTGTPSRRVEISKSGIVEFAFVQENQADRTITRGVYNAGNFTKIVKCYFKEWDDEIRYYEITSDRIYETDSNGIRLKSDECCGLLQDSNCSCESQYFEGTDW